MTSTKSETDALGHTVLHVYTPSGRLQQRWQDENGDGELDSGDALLMKGVSHFMGNPKIPGTVGNYRMGDLSDDMALTAFGTGMLTTPIALAPACAGAGGLAAAKSAPNAYYATMAAAGTPMGQRVLSNSFDFVSSAVPATSPTPNMYGFYGWLAGEFWGEMKK